MDLISEVIRMVRVGSVGSRLIRHSDPRGVRFPPFAGSGFHIMLRGTCWLITEDQPPVQLHPGDIVLTSSGAQHGLAQTPRPLADLPDSEMGPIPPAPGPCDFEFLCGAYRLEHGQAPQYLRALPDLIAVSPDHDRYPEMRAFSELLTAETASARPGSGATVRSLLDLILVQVLRQWHEQHGTEPGTDDPAIAAALRQIHEHPQRQWTVDKLSAVAGLPRTAFTRRFAALVGQPPMSYLITWRLGRGARLLREVDAPLATIARQIGYSTEFAFSTAFRREYGVSPSQFRRTASTTV
ncbi:MAG TPA: AraC family transcriptional regulator [Pseudonocardiaceae bacterium]